MRNPVNVQSMIFSCPNVYIILASLTLTDTVLTVPVPQMESIASIIINRYNTVIYDVQIICEMTCFTNDFIKTIPVPIQLSKPHLHENSLVILLPQSESFITTVLNSAANSTKSKFVVFVECSECVTVTWILQQFWQHNLLNVVVIPIYNETLQIYTYFPFRDGLCFDPSPVVIDSFTNSFSFNVELFPKRKVWNLLNCTLRVSSFNYFPGVYFDDIHQEMKGVFSPVFKAVANSMNFSPEFIHIEGTEWFGGVSGPKKTGIRGDVYTGRAHLGFSFLQPIDFNHLDYDSLAMTACVTWCLPATFKHKSLWCLYMDEFSPSVWLMLLLSTTGMVATDFVAQRSNQRVCSKSGVMYVWAALLQASERLPRYSSVSLRILWIFWLMSCLVLSAAYLGTLKSLRTAPYREYSVKNLEDLAQTGFQAWYVKGLEELVNNVSETNPAVAQIKSKSYRYPSEMTGTMIRLFPYKNITVLLIDKVCQMYSEIYVNELKLYPVPNACMQVTSWHFFVMRRKSVFTEAVTIQMGRLTQAGIVQRSLSEIKSLSRRINIHRRAISLRTVLPALVMLAYGLAVSFIIFMLEKVSMYVWRNRGK